MKAVEKTYKCRFCFNSFTKKVRTVSGPGGPQGNPGKHNKGSTQVQCPFCLNFCKTW